MTEAGYPNGIDLDAQGYPGDPLHANFGLAVVAGLKGSPFRVTAKQIPADDLLGHRVDEGPVLRRRLEPASSRRDARR